MKRFSIYVAASSQEIDRAEHWMIRLQEEGVHVTSTWIQSIRKVGVANPADATREQRAAWAHQDADEVVLANGLWLLMPTKPTSGAWWEFGYAFGLGKHLWISGPSQSRSIFTGLADRSFEKDAEALEDIVNHANARRASSTVSG
jgi:nucleoside 2-deoxyribosyltransferase